MAGEIRIPWLLARSCCASTSTSTRRSSQTTRAEYIERITAGGLPAALRRAPGSTRARWFDDYLRLTLERDVRHLSRLEQGAVLPRLLERLAGQTGQVLNIAKAAAPLQIKERTADNYVQLLEAVFLLHRLPAWDTTLTSRSAARPKVHMVDSGVAARLLRLTPKKLNRREPSALTELGHLVETFVVGELMKQASWLDGIAGVGHWRTRDDDEVDLVIEHEDGAVLAFEVKAAQRVLDRDLAPIAEAPGGGGVEVRRGRDLVPRLAVVSRRWPPPRPAGGRALGGVNGARGTCRRRAGAGEGDATCMVILWYENYHRQGRASGDPEALA